MAFAGGITLVVAGLFMLYALVQFHREATKPRRARRVHRPGVIVLRRNIAPVRPAASAVAIQPDAGTAERQAGGKGQPLPYATLPAGVRRLAVKRAGRS